ncbi:MAG: peroxiredoxin [Bacteroidia bacterium]|nr:peroxiredoxin [Bacteroidia bacterium]MDW8088166.1 peroxiredoxin [Bacteroidia bacterium]
MWRILSLLSGFVMGQVGQKVAEKLTFSDEEGRQYSFSQLRGKWVVLFFYPHDDTPGCTQEAKEFTRLLPAYEEIGARVFGVSTQDAKSHKAFKQKHCLKVPLIVDKEGQIAEYFQVKRFFGLCSRDIVVIDPEGRIAHVARQVSPSEGPKATLEWLRQTQRAQN